MRTRRSVRDFAPDPVRRELIENALRVAGSAPSGANQQPWTFVERDDASTGCLGQRRSSGGSRRG
jgi:nitroreductase